MDQPISNDAAGEVKQPVIFQCDKCLSIVGDSIAYVQADESTGTITLAAMRGVACKENSLQTSKAGKDIGCTFVSVHCKQCDVALGKMYKTTSREFDPIRDYYTLKLEALRGYELGKYDQEAKVGEGLGIPPEIREIREKLYRIEQMIVVYDERFQRLEKLIGIESGVDDKESRSKESERGRERERERERDDAQRRKMQRTGGK